MHLLLQLNRTVRMTRSNTTDTVEHFLFFLFPLGMTSRTTNKAIGLRAVPVRELLLQCGRGTHKHGTQIRLSDWTKAAPLINTQTLLTGEIQKGTGGRGRDRKCHKLSWRVSQIVVTFYDDLWRFMTFYDVLCQWNKETEIVIQCRKLSWHVVNCRDVCRKLSWHFFSRPLPAVPFWISPT